MRRIPPAKARAVMDTISTETFMGNIARLSANSEKAGVIWCSWAQDLADMDCPDPGIPGQPPEHFLAWIWKEFQEVARDYGDAAVEKVLDISLYPHCLFPWEIYRAGEEFSLGRSTDEVVSLSLAGMLDKHPEQNEGALDMST